MWKEAKIIFNLTYYVGRLLRPQHCVSTADEALVRADGPAIQESRVPKGRGGKRFKGPDRNFRQFWQKRLPSYLLTHSIDRIEAANIHIDQLRLHHNAQEIHRELDMPPQKAWMQAKRQGRFVLRPFHEDPWWRYIWSVRTRVRVGVDGTVPVGHLRQSINGRIGGWVLHCRHPDGSISILANEPGRGGPPILLLRYEGSGPDWTV